MRRGEGGSETAWQLHAWEHISKCFIPAWGVRGFCSKRKGWYEGCCCIQGDEHKLHGRDKKGLSSHLRLSTPKLDPRFAAVGFPNTVSLSVPWFLALLWPVPPRRWAVDVFQSCPRQGLPAVSRASCLGGGSRTYTPTEVICVVPLLSRVHK